MIQPQVMASKSVSHCHLCSMPPLIVTNNKQTLWVELTCLIQHSKRVKGHSEKKESQTRD